MSFTFSYYIKGKYQDLMLNVEMNGIIFPLGKFWNLICRLYNGKAAEQELKSLQDQATSSFTFGKDLIKHNLVVFRNGESALQVFLTQ